MSFYLDDDDDVAGFTAVGAGVGLSAANNSSRKGIKDAQSVDGGGSHNNAEHGFFCDNCGGTESYLDDTSGGLVCVDCFTQSQTMIAASQELIDYDESMALAGRVSGFFRRSNLLPRGGALSGGGRTASRKRKRLSEIDQSASLPNTEQCLLGVQRLLRELISIIVAKKLMMGKGKNQGIKKVAMESARTIWKAYLTSWIEGADYYGALYPEVRFCFRDLFLSTYVRMRILRVLTHEASKKVREEMRMEEELKEEDQAQAGSSTSQDDGVKTEGNETKTSLEGVEDFPHGDIEIVQRRRDRSGNNNGEEDGDDDDDVVDYDDDDISRSVYSVTQTNGNEDNQAPSSNTGGNQTAIARLILSHQKMTGKSRKNMGRKAVALSLSPSLPMIAAIVCMAFAPFGVTCADIQAWIEDGSLPLLNAFPLLTPQEQRKLKLIQGFFRLREPPSVPQLTKLVANLQVACGYEPKLVRLRKTKVSGNDKEVVTINPQTLKSNKMQQPGRLLTPRSLPLVLARIVSQLGLSQKVLDYSLALMGLPIVVVSEEEPLQLPRSLSACRSDRVVGMPELLGVVVTSCQFIQRWEDHWYVVPSSVHDENESSERTASKKTDEPSQFVPWNEDMSRHIGALSKDHLDMLENNMFNIEQSRFFNYDELDTVTSNNYFDSSMEEQSDRRSSTSAAVVPCSTLLKAVTRQPTTRRRKFHQKGGRLVLCEKESGVKGLVPPPPPFGTLVEYVSSKTGTKPNDVLRFCRKLEEEMYQKRESLVALAKQSTS